MVIIGGRTRRSRANLGVTTAGRQEGRAEVALSVASAGAPASVAPVGGPEGILPPRRSANPGPRPHTMAASCMGWAKGVHVRRGTIRP